MSGNRKADARVRRTRDALGDALVALMTERPFESITVQHVLDRAGVGRSTFYVHYSGKDDLLSTDVDEFWSHMANRLSVTNERSDRVAPVRELFAHVAGMVEFLGALDAAGKRHEVTEAGRVHFAHAIEDRLARSGRGSHLPAVHREAMAHAQAGAIFSMLDWWLANGEPIPPAEVDDLFHRAFWSGVARQG
ncbi:MAG TPA: TetR/AcrR family transcriptional regulator [Thermoanaerobaculia bacterium]|nr:TetR/AcrR family transcriptional regulator [Thermoanaerobaculia bacterium]